MKPLASCKKLPKLVTRLFEKGFMSTVGRLLAKEIQEEKLVECTTPHRRQSGRQVRNHFKNSRTKIIRRFALAGADAGLDADFWTGRFTLADTDAEPRKVARMFSHRRSLKKFGSLLLLRITNFSS